MLQFARRHLRFQLLDRFFIRVLPEQFPECRLARESLDERGSFSGRHTVDDHQLPDELVYVRDRLLLLTVLLKRGEWLTREQLVDRRYFALQ